jgi:hypothetical protein
MARHAAVDLNLVFKTRPRVSRPDRLTESEFEKLCNRVRSGATMTPDNPTPYRSFVELRGLYEPFIIALADYFQFEVPPFEPARRGVDNWQTSPWAGRSPGLSELQGVGADEEHRD